MSDTPKTGGSQSVLPQASPTLAEVAAALKDHVQSGAGPWCRDCAGDWPCRFAALLARIPADAELFDVERLARALRTIHLGPAPWPGPMTSEEMATAILAAAKEMI